MLFDRLQFRSHDIADRDGRWVQPGSHDGHNDVTVVMIPTGTGPHSSLRSLPSSAIELVI